MKLFILLCLLFSNILCAQEFDSSTNKTLSFGLKEDAVGYIYFSDFKPVSNNKSIDLLIYFNKLPLELKFDFCDKIFDTTKPCAASLNLKIINIKNKNIINLDSGFRQRFFTEFKSNDGFTDVVFPSISNKFSHFEEFIFLDLIDNKNKLQNITLEEGLILLSETLYKNTQNNIPLNRISFHMIQKNN